MAERTKILTRDGQNLSSYLSEIWAYRFLAYTLANRQLKVKFAQTTLGILWVVLNPIISTAILIFIFGGVSNLTSLDWHGVQTVLAGVLVYNWFSMAVSESSNTIVSFQNMIKKIFFPKINIPISSVLSTIPDALIVFVFWLGSSILINRLPSLLSIVMGISLTFLLTSIGSLLSSYLVARFRDFKYVIPVILRAGYFLTPIGYASEKVPERFRFVVDLNPLSVPIDLLRGVPIAQLHWQQGASLVFSLLVLCILIGQFKKLESSIADFI